jgi:chromosome segregation ATPase
MDIEKLTQAIKDIVIGELKQEFKEFRTEVRGELAGYRLAIESLSERMKNIENDIRDIRRAIGETNKKIDEVKDSLSVKIDEVKDSLSVRIDEVKDSLSVRIDSLLVRIDEVKDSLSVRIDSLSVRIDDLYMEVSEIKGDLKKALADKVVIEDMILRIERLEEKVAA